MVITTKHQYIVNGLNPKFHEKIVIIPKYIKYEM